jgi:membrane-associated phospholipid phosphatase
MVRFLSRGYEWAQRHIYIGYVLIVLFQTTLMFSRVILGMHTFNEVLMGAMIGLFSILLYYAYV